MGLLTLTMEGDMRYNNHLKIGYTTNTHKGVNIASALNSQKYEAFLQSMNGMPYNVGYIPPGYEHRADLISNLFYNTPTFDWIILQFNNISDPFQGLNVGDRILIPIIN